MRHIITLILVLFASTSFAANTVTLQWEPSPSPGEISYYVSYWDTIAPATVYTKNVGPVLTTTVDSLAPAVDWVFTVTAYNALDQSVQSNQVTTSFAAYQPPADVVHEPIVIPLPPGGTVTITVTP